jgi:formylglycine-generating enzyme required for sulfatase activity
MAAKVFISYRREDAKYQARMIHAAFCQAIPREQVFMDVDSIPPGANFRKILKGWVDQCDVLLAVIGAGWIDAQDPKTDRRRLETSSDFVRIEIGEALTRGIPVVPVLIDGTPMPEIEFLPDDLKELVDRQAEFVDFRTFDDDVKRLIRKLQLDSVSRAEPTPPSAIVIDVRGKSRAFVPGNGRMEWFTDHPHGPEMVVVPAGTFMLGSPDNEPARRENEGSQQRVTIPQPFAVARHAITRGQFGAFVNNTNSKMERGAHVWVGNWKLDPKASWYNPGFRQDDSHPVVCVSWDDANAYAEWLSDQSGKKYRLLTEAGWEYAARAGTTAPFWWGSSISTTQANYDGNNTYAGGGAKGEWRKATVPAGIFEATPGAYSTCTAMCGSGARTSGTITTAAHQTMGRHGCKAEIPLAGWFAVVPGTAILGAFAPPVAAAGAQTPGTTIRASGWPGRYIFNL